MFEQIAYTLQTHFPLLSQLFEIATASAIPLALTTLICAAFVSWLIVGVVTPKRQVQPSAPAADCHGNEPNNQTNTINSHDSDSYSDDDSNYSNDSDSSGSQGNNDEGENEAIDSLATPTIPFHLPTLSDDEITRRAADFYATIQSRRSVRHFSRQPVPLSAIRHAIMAAATAPSGAHMQPWTFVCVTQPTLKRAIRSVVEREERINYQRRMGQRWLNDLRPLGTNWKKRYLTEVPVLLLLFRHTYTQTGQEDVEERTEETETTEAGGESKNTRGNTYYSEISASIACGLLITALHTAGLATLTSTPLHCGQQLRRLLQRPANERLLLLMPVGRPAAGCRVPQLSRKRQEQVIIEM